MFGVRSRVVALKPALAYALGRSPPGLVSIDVSGDCNLRCVMCSLHDSNPRRGLMSLADFERLCGDLDGIPVIELSSGCEPTLNGGLAEMVGLLRARHPAAFIDLTTNATLLDDRLIEALRVNRVDKLLVSLDGGDRLAYERVRIGARFDRVVTNVSRLLHDLARHGASRPTVEVIVTFMTLNADQLVPLVDLCARLGIPSLIVNGLVPFSETVEPLVMWGLTSEPAGVGELARMAAADARARGVKLQFPDFVAHAVERCVECNPVISWDGDVSPCFMTSFARTAYLGGTRVPMPRVVLGNALRRPLRDIWRSPRAVAFRARRALGSLPEYCRACAMQMGVLCPYRTLDA